MERQHEVHTLEPWYDRRSNVLILGTFPSPKSREYGSYYGHPQNRFWSTLASVFEESIPTTVSQRQAFVKRHHIALWDVLASCSIRGADDASIVDPVPNDLPRLLDATEIRAIFTTGKKAKALYDALLFPRIGREAILLPSTSPANRRWFDDKALVDAYRVIRSYCG